MPDLGAGVFDPVTTGLTDARAGDLDIDGDRLIVYLRDGRDIYVPLAWYPELAAASSTERNWWRITQDGRAIHWHRLGVAVLVQELLRV